ncbi:unnamed protein product [Plutella xylostella]|uniref:(diamondback moth) hypothetical protein n=1 Tax=Plutella xylostella TaxID=51655 RepID=A0A8S4G2F1_PLUXY|nr:unnamed protein product [Plutella xylostella]
MAAKLMIVFGLVAAAAAVPLVPVEPEAPAHYEYSYSVQDSHSGDVKQQQESRQGDAVHGSYSLLQPDGVQRIVEYSADEHSGFVANVRYEGHPQQPAKIALAPVAKVAYAAPVAKIAYAAPVAKIAYAAPVAKIAYAAPVAKIAYAAPVAKVAYSTPVHYAAAPQYYAAPAPQYYAAPAKLVAPVAKLAYAQPAAAHFTFSSPAVSYHH